MTIFTFKGKFFYLNGGRYEGEFENGNRHGKGKKKETLLFVYYGFNFFLIKQHYWLLKESTTRLMEGYTRENSKTEVVTESVRRETLFMFYYWFIFSIIK